MAKKIALLEKIKERILERLEQALLAAGMINSGLLAVLANKRQNLKNEYNHHVTILCYAGTLLEQEESLPAGLSLRLMALINITRLNLVELEHLLSQEQSSPEENAAESSSFKA